MRPGRRGFLGLLLGLPFVRGLPAPTCAAAVPLPPAIAHGSGIAISADLLRALRDRYAVGLEEILFDDDSTSPLFALCERRAAR